MDETIIYKYLSQKTTPEEERELLEWINESPANKELFFEIKMIWASRHTLPRDEKEEEVLNISLEKLNNRIDQALNKRRSHVYRKIRIWASIAAVIGLGLLSYVFFYAKPDKVEHIVYTNEFADSVKTVILADGTSVWLRSNTTLTCPAAFYGGIREVEIDGEAFFDVRKDEATPFIVKTDKKLIKVLGTSFSINTRASGDLIETILMSGSVQLQRIGGESLTVLQPSQQALYSRKTKTLEINDVDANVLTSWRYGLISLSDVSIQTIVQCIEDTYNVKVSMDTVQLRNRKYNFSFKKSKGINAALKQLTFMTGCEAEVAP